MYTIPVRFVSTYDYFLKVYVQFPTSADNVTLLASAADRRAAAAPLLLGTCCRSAVQRSIDIACMPARRPAPKRHRTGDGWDRRTEGQRTVA